MNKVDYERKDYANLAKEFGCHFRIGKRAIQFLPKAPDGKPYKLFQIVKLDGWITDLKEVEAFSSGGHSGASASYAIGIIEKLLQFKPLSPLTYEPDEWTDVSEMSGTPMWQNKRDGEVFSTDGGKTHYSLSDPPPPTLTTKGGSSWN